MSLSTLRKCRLAAFLCINAVFSLVPSAAAQADHSFYLPIEIQGARQVSPVAINDYFEVTGTYLDANLNLHAFVADIFGKTTTFDVPNSPATYPTAINNAGEVTGSYFLTGVVGSAGFVRSAKGKITTFNVGSNSTTTTFPRDINDHGLIVGVYADDVSYPPAYAFIRHPDGGFVTFSLPGIDELVPTGVNDKGEVTGFASTNAAFIRNRDGVIVQFDDGSDTVPYGINNAGTVSGWAYASGADLGFIRSAAGALTTFNAPEGGHVYQQNVRINQAGEVVGAYYVPPSTQTKGFLRSCDGRITSFSPPGAVVTLPAGINRFGVVTGTYTKADGIQRGFLRIP
jgi:hypothetical protein